MRFVTWCNERGQFGGDVKCRSLTGFKLEVSTRAAHSPRPLLVYEHAQRTSRPGVQRKWQNVT